MTDEQRQVIESYFTAWRRDIERAGRLVQTTEYHLEGILVLSCYVGALAALRFPGKKDWEAYRMVVNRYSGIKLLYKKVDLLFFYQWPRSMFRRHGTYRKLKNYSRIKRILIKHFGDEEAVRNSPKQRFPTQATVCRHLLAHRFKGFDPQNLKSNLAVFSVCDLLYRYVRCPAVHNKQFPLVRKHWINPEEQWFEDVHIITGDVLLETVRNIAENIKKECLAKGKWPFELHNR